MRAREAEPELETGSCCSGRFNHSWTRRIIGAEGFSLLLDMLLLLMARVVDWMMDGKMDGWMMEGNNE